MTKYMYLKIGLAAIILNIYFFLLSCSQNNELMNLDNNMWKNLNETTWFNWTKGFAGESYSFYEISNEKKCIKQINGSGVYVISSEISNVEINQNQIFLSFENSKDTLLYMKETLFLPLNKIPLKLRYKPAKIFNRLGELDFSILKSDTFNLQKLDLYKTIEKK